MDRVIIIWYLNNGLLLEIITIYTILDKIILKLERSNL